MNRNNGFTLIELLVVVAIIGTISSIVLGSITNSRNKAEDSKRRSELRQINLAINLYYLAFNRMPKNYHCGDHVCAPMEVASRGVCDAIVPDVPGADAFNVYPAAWDATMQDLVNAGLLGYIPRSSGGPGYCYYDFGTGGLYAGALLMTSLETAAPSTTGVPPSCRPWTSVNGTWCEQRNTTEYCLCNPY